MVLTPEQRRTVLRTGLIAFALGTACFVALALGHATHPSGHSFDFRVLSGVEELRAAWLTPLMRGMSAIGTALVLYPLLLLAGLLLWWRRGEWLPGVLALLWLWLGQLVRVAINSGIARPRPQSSQLVHASGYAFPSGHASTSTIGYALLALLLMRLVSRRWWWVLALVGVTVPVLVGLSRLYLGVHWPSDVVAGWAFGAAWVALGLLGFAVVSRSRLRGRQLDS